MNQSSSINFVLKSKHGEGVSISILKKAKAANASFETQQYFMLLDSTPRRYDILFGSFSIYKTYQFRLLDLAISRNLNEIFRYLLDDGSPAETCVNRTVHGVHDYHEPRRWTPLLKRGASPKPFKRGLSAFHIATAANIPDIIERIAGYPSFHANHPDVNGDTALIHAIASPYSDTSLVSLLVRLGADVNQSAVHEGQYVSPFNVACFMGRFDLALELLKHGAVITDLSEVMIDGSGLGPLYPLRHACVGKLFRKPHFSRERRDVLNAILEKGADVNRLGHDGESLIVELARKKLRTPLKYLLRCGIDRLDIEQTDAQGKTALARALSTNEGDPDLARLLLRYGAQIQSSSTYTTFGLINEVWNARIPKDIWKYWTITDRWYQIVNF